MSTRAPDAPDDPREPDAPDDPREPDAPVDLRKAPAGPGRRGRFASLAAALGIAALVAVAVLQTIRVADRDEQLDERRAVAAAAGAVAEAILSYDYTDTEGSLERLHEHIGGEFEEVYDETFRAVQVPLITQLEAVATAVVNDTYVTEVDGDTAKAIVLVDQTVQSTAGLRTLTGTFLQMELVKRDGRWIVEEIPLRISSRNETVTGDPIVPEDPAASTTTTPTTTTTPP